jgi:hypothetical protein
MFLVPEGEKLALHQVQIQSGEGIFNPFLFHHAKPRSKEGLSLCPFRFMTPSLEEWNLRNAR